MTTDLLLLVVERLTLETGSVAGATLVTLGALLWWHRRSIAKVYLEAEYQRRIAPVPRVTVVTQPQFQPLPAPVAAPLVAVPSVATSIPLHVPAMCENDICALCCAAVAETRKHVHGHSVRYTPDQVRKAAVQMARRMAKGPLPADIEARIRKELAGPAAIREADHG